MAKIIISDKLNQLNIKPDELLLIYAIELFESLSVEEQEHIDYSSLLGESFRKIVKQYGELKNV